MSKIIKMNELIKLTDLMNESNYSIYRYFGIFLRK